MSYAWQCPCCSNIMAPWMVRCPFCCIDGQLVDDVRAVHDCPIFGRKVDEAFRAMMRDVPAIVEPAPVPPRPRMADVMIDTNDGRKSLWQFTQEQLRKNKKPRG